MFLKTLWLAERNKTTPLPCVKEADVCLRSASNSLEHLPCCSREPLRPAYHDTNPLSSDWCLLLRRLGDKATYNALKVDSRCFTVSLLCTKQCLLRDAHCLSGLGHGGKLNVVATASVDEIAPPRLQEVPPFEAQEGTEGCKYKRQHGGQSAETTEAHREGAAWSTELRVKDGCIEVRRKTRLAYLCIAAQTVASVQMCLRIRLEAAESSAKQHRKQEPCRSPETADQVHGPEISVPRWRTGSPEYPC